MSTNKKISNADLIELVDQRRQAGEIIIDCLHDKNGIWYNIRENAEMSKEEVESLSDQFLRKNEK